MKKSNYFKELEKSNKEKHKERYQKLLDQAKEKQQKRLSVERSKVDSNEGVKKKSVKVNQDEVSRLNKQVMDLKRQLKRFKNDAALERKKSRAVKSELKAVKAYATQQLQDAENIREDADKRFKEANRLLNDLRLSGWDEENTALEEVKLRNELIAFLLQDRIKMKRYVDKEHQRDRRYNQKIQERDHKIEELKELIKETRKFSVQQERRLENLQIKSDKLQSRYKKMQQNLYKINSINPQDVIPRLIQQLDSRTFRSFNQLNTLFEKYQWLFLHNSREMNQAQSDVLYGYLEVTTEQDLFFHDINDEIILPLKVHRGYDRKDLLVDGMAIQVFRKLDEPDVVSIGYCYPIVEKETTEERKLKKKTATKKNHPQDIFANEEVKKWVAGLSLTVVGNKRVKPFVALLSKYVKKVEQIDAYEKGEDYVFNHLRSSDYAFVLLDSVPHTVTTFVKSYDPLGQKIQIFNLPNEEDGLIRLNYLYWNQAESR